MAKTLYFDCFSGASGDMVLGALLDLGLPLESLRGALGSLAVEYGGVSADRVLRAGVSAIKFRVMPRKRRRSTRTRRRRARRPRPRTMATRTTTHTIMGARTVTPIRTAIVIITITRILTELRPERRSAGITIIRITA